MMDGWMAGGAAWGPVAPRDVLLLMSNTSSLYHLCSPHHLEVSTALIVCADVYTRTGTRFQRLPDLRRRPHYVPPD